MDGFIVLFVVAFIGIVVAVVAHYAYNASQPTVTRKAKVVGKRTVTGQNNQASYLACSSSTAASGEYAIGANDYALVVAGDTGELDTRGSLFWGFPPRRQHRVKLPTTKQPPSRLRCGVNMKMDEMDFQPTATPFGLAFGAMTLGFGTMFVMSLAGAIAQFGGDGLAEPAFLFARRCSGRRPI